MHKDTPEEGIHHPLNLLLMLLELEDREEQVNLSCAHWHKATRVNYDFHHFLFITGHTLNP